MQGGPPQYPPPYGQPPYGQQPQQQAYGQPPYGQQPYGQPGFPQQQGMPPKKSNTTLFVVLGLVIGLPILGVGGCFAARASRVSKNEASCSASYSSDCKKYGRCHSSSTGYTCIATEDADCRKSENCKEFGACSLKSDSCYATKVEDCRAATACKEKGMCDLSGTFCRPTKAEHCTASSECTGYQKRCELRTMSCVNPTEESSSSSYSGSSSSSSSSSSGSSPTIKYTCPSNCTYIGGGKCRCRR